MPAALTASAPPPILRSPCYVFGDSHLGYASRDVERNVIAYLKYLRTAAGSVVINGLLAQGNTNAEQFGASIDAMRRTDDDRITTNAAYLYGRQKVNGITSWKESAVNLERSSYP